MCVCGKDSIPFTKFPYQNLRQIGYDRTNKQSNKDYYFKYIYLKLSLKFVKNKRIDFEVKTI